jgi:hypothetical protein
MTAAFAALASHALDDTTLDRAVAEFGQFAYQRRPYAARNWGHPLHSLCSYPSKLKPALAHFLVAAFTSPGDRVLDPFAGVGTLPFEACIQGRIGVANDLSPFAYAVAAAKVNPPSTEGLECALSDFEQELAAAAAAADLAAVPPEIRSFFHDDTCREVLGAKALLFTTPLGTTPAGYALTAALCHVLHGNRPYALSRRSHGIIPIPPKGEFVYKSVATAVRDKLARASFDTLPDNLIPGEAYNADAFCLAELVAPVDAIITSPPFLGTTEFLRQNRVRLWFCGMGLEAQQAEKLRFVEHRRDLDFYTGLLTEWRRSARLGARLILHLGVVRSHDMACEITPHVEAAGFEVHAILYEPVPHLESHGRTDRGATHTHQFLIASASPTSAA